MITTPHQQPLTHNQVTLVNESDEVIGEMDKIEAHRGDGKRHRAISVYLFRKKGDEPELLIQQRSAEKIVGAHQWANTVCGNVRPTETYEECAYRRLREELGITKVEIKPIYKFEYHLQCNDEFSEWEMDQVFIGFYDGEVRPNPKEAQDYLWLNWEELLSQKEKGKRGKYSEIKIQLLPTTYQLPISLAPWFVWMLNDEKLITILQNFIKK